MGAHMTDKKSSRIINNKNRAVRTAYFGVLTALGFVLAYLESLIPPFTGIPGVKPGFANIVTLIALYLMGPVEAAAVGIVRVLLSGISFNGLFAMLYGLAGTLLSLAGMLLLKKSSRFSCAAVSCAGGILHNAGQIAVACLVTGRAVVYYLPVLVLSGAAAGIITGVISFLVISRLSRILPSFRSQS